MFVAEKRAERELECAAAGESPTQCDRSSSDVFDFASMATQ
jgi:hypothetical protein